MRVSESQFRTSRLLLNCSVRHKITAVLDDRGPRTQLCPLSRVVNNQ